MPVFDPHTHVLEDGGMKQTDWAQLGFKRKVDGPPRTLPHPPTSSLTLLPHTCLPRPQVDRQMQRIIRTINSRQVSHGFYAPAPIISRIYQVRASPTLSV